jgi:hypothetical protein
LATPLSDPGAWKILRRFAGLDMTLPQAEKCLLQHLGSCYKNEDWRHALKAVMDAEGDVVKAQQAIQKISATCKQPKLTIKLPQNWPLLKQVGELCSRPPEMKSHIWRTPIH